MNGAASCGTVGIVSRSGAYEWAQKAIELDDPELYCVHGAGKIFCTKTRTQRLNII
jgi:hypothetical protein